MYDVLDVVRVCIVRSLWVKETDGARERERDGEKERKRKREKERDREKESR